MKNNFKRMIAAVLLAALVLTGVINTFAVAEEAEPIIEAQFVEEEIVAASVDAAVEEAEMSLTEGGDLPTDEEAVEEVEEADLGELTGEADEPVIEDEDKQQLMADLIGMVVEDRRTEGIYAALNATFATLADNAAVLANPETGVIETEGSAIIDMTYDALSANFDNSPEQLMGAIGAAAARADSAGYIQTLGGNAALVSLAATEEEKWYDEEKSKKMAKAYFDNTLDTLAAFGEFRPISR